MPPSWLPDQARVGREFCPTSPTQGECVQLISLGGPCRFDITIHVRLSRCFLSLPMLAVWVWGSWAPCWSNPFNLFVVPCRLSSVAPDPNRGNFFLFSLFRHKCFLHHGPQGLFCFLSLGTSVFYIMDPRVPGSLGMRDARYLRLVAHCYMSDAP
jgi:hypothetical protein